MLTNLAMELSSIQQSKISSCRNVVHSLKILVFLHQTVAFQLSANFLNPMFVKSFLLLYIFSITTRSQGIKFNCEQNNATANLETRKSGTNCLSNLEVNPALYEPCRQNTCFLFTEERPFVSFNSSEFNKSARHLQSPFPCGNPTDLHWSLTGVSFDIHRMTSTRDNLCMWAGDASECELDSLVDFTEVMADKGYKFAITGAIIEIPKRQCHHNPSRPIIRGKITILSKFTETEDSVLGAWTRLIRPFRWETWAVFAIFFLFFVAVAVLVGFRLRYVRGMSRLRTILLFVSEFSDGVTSKPSEQKEEIPLRVIPSSKYNYSSSSNNTEDTESVSIPEEEDRNDGDNSSASATAYEITRSLFRIGLVAFFAIFLLFYEVALVDFLFIDQPTTLRKAVNLLSAEDLGYYSIRRNTALESIWNATVNPDGAKFDGGDDSAIPWKRCNSDKECLEWVLAEDNLVRFAVTYVTVGNFLLQDDVNCDWVVENLITFETSDVFYSIDAGWLYNGAVDEEFKKQVDRELLELGISGKISDTIQRKVGEPACGKERKPEIRLLIVLIPCLLFVLPPLTAAVIVLLFWKKCWSVNTEGDPVTGTRASRFKGGGKASEREGSAVDISKES